MSISEELKKYLYVPSGEVTTEAVFGVMRQSGSQDYLSRVSSSSGAFSNTSYAGSYGAQETLNASSTLNKKLLDNQYYKTNQESMVINQLYSNSSSSSSSEAYSQGYMSSNDYANAHSLNQTTEINLLNPSYNQVVVSNAGDFDSTTTYNLNQGALNNIGLTTVLAPAATANQNTLYVTKSYSSAGIEVPIKVETEAQNYGSEFARNASSFASYGSTDKVHQITQDLLKLSMSGNLDACAYSELESAIMRASRPFELPPCETININGQTGMWINKNEALNWRGPIAISQYEINGDTCPEIIRKATDQVLIYEQEVAVRYLRPPTPPPPGEILIRQEKNIPTPPAPPLIIRQQPPRPETPAPLVYREIPPRAPVAVGAKVITISGKRLPPPPRKVVIERLAPLPSKPQSVIIERWLPYRSQKRRVIFQRNTVPDPVVVKPKNIIIQWEPPKVSVKREFRDLGVIRANPVEYVQRYGAELKAYDDMPSFVKEIRPPQGVLLASDYQAPPVFELEGDLQALNYVDLDANGLSEYKYLVSRSSALQSSSQIASNMRLNSELRSSTIGLNSASQSSAIGINSLAQNEAYASLNSERSAEYRSSAQNFSEKNFSTKTSTSYATANMFAGSSESEKIIAEIFASIDRNNSGKITLSEAERVLLVLNSRLGRSYGEDEALAFFRALDTNRDGSIDFDEFKSALLTFIEL